MLFNSATFIFVFLPGALLAVRTAQYFGGRRTAAVTLIVASLVFYGSWRLRDLAVVGASIAANLVIVRGMARGRSTRGAWLAAGIAVNLLLLAYFKYLNFAVASLAALTGVETYIISITLPLGLSFYTLQQISFLTDAYKGKLSGTSPREYIVSVLFFPHLIAGPLVHYRAIIGQLRTSLAVSGATIWAGVPVFVVGLTKKVVLADSLGTLVTPIFAASAAGPMEFVGAWTAALGYSAQLYYDFSGYSDMAIGLGLMFGIGLPVNFLSPYKARSIIDFWRRWHITLSEFLRDHLYIPLGGNRRGAVRGFANLMIVMLLGGLWHGAAWTFVAWGALHGVYVVVNHAWTRWTGLRLPVVAPVLTFVCVVVGWVLFRAPSFDAFANLVAGMTGINGVALPGAIAYLLQLGPSPWPWLRFDDSSYIAFLFGIPLIAMALLIAWFAPNAAQIFGLRPSGGRERATSTLEAIAVACLAWVCLFAIAGGVQSEFLYFKF